MGFRCPNCKADFGHSQDTLKEHLTTCELGHDMAVIVLNMNEDTIAQNKLGIAGHRVMRGKPKKERKK